jgi:hypothetical protein
VHDLAVDVQDGRCTGIVVCSDLVDNHLDTFATMTCSMR